MLVITSEYSTGTIRSTLLAVPTRLPMLAAKSVVLAALIFVATEAIAIASFFLGVAILHAKVPVSLGDPGVLRVILGMGLYLTMLGLFSMAIGGLFRNTVAGITGVIAFVMVLPVLSQLLPGSLVKHVHVYLPTEAGRLVGQAHQGSGDLLSPWQGFGVFCLWTALFLAFGAFALRRRNA
ncbi:MAG: transporter permease [Actinomycetia bacterium]|nr:transporter permease [Actinomycetes bacterium]